MGKNATYTNERMVQEFLSVLGDQIEVDQLSELSASPFFSLSTLAAICQALPVTTVDCKRAFSAMKCIKS